MRDIAAITDTIRQSVSALDAGRELGLRPDRSGRCKCPLHESLRENMKLWQDDRGFYCFQCNAAGDVIKLVQLVNGCSFLSAVEWLNSAFHLGLPLDRPMDKNAAEAARRTKERKQAEREQKQAIERMEFDLYVLCGRLLDSLEADKERYRPRGANEELDERFVNAVRMIPEVEETAEELAVRVIGVNK